MIGYQIPGAKWKNITKNTSIVLCFFLGEKKKEKRGKKKRKSPKRVPVSASASRCLALPSHEIDASGSCSPAAQVPLYQKPPPDMRNVTSKSLERSPRVPCASVLVREKVEAPRMCELFCRTR